MERIIATEVPPDGMDEEIMSYLFDNAHRLNLGDAVLYYGFPVFKDYEEITVKSKFLVVSPMHGAVLLHTTSIDEVVHEDVRVSQVFSYIDASARKSKLLRMNKKELKIHLDSALFCFDEIDDDELDSTVITSLEGFYAFFEELLLPSALEDELLKEFRSIIEGSKALSGGTKRAKISDDPSTKSNILIKLENEIKNYDVEQRKVAISLINGPQRIRGLAGSGKTVVLAMKAAHIHLQYPERKILFTFYTKSLYGLIRDSISRFYRHFAGVEPDWEKIDILHAWGGKTIEGVIYNAWIENDLPIISFQHAKMKNYDDPFQYVCAATEAERVASKYHHILIDEAQDLPNEFFQICYELARGRSGHEKNIVWAYDELQSIFNIYQRTAEELFGDDADGNPRVDMTKFRQRLNYGQTNDLVLHRCYRNPLEVLVTAHALGFGLYAESPVQMLENAEHWEDVGYEVEEGELDDDGQLVIGSKVRIVRVRENSPLSIYNFQDKNDIVQCFSAASLREECDWVSGSIMAALSEGLKPHDVLVICLDDTNARTYFSAISRTLSEHNVRSNNLLTSSSAAPPFKLDDMVTLSTVHRAKGNEASIVFAIGLDALYVQRELRSARNKIFTAFTRTKAWLKVSGVGRQAEFFINEIRTSLENSPYLNFVVPDKEVIETIQRDLEGEDNSSKQIQKLVSDMRDQGLSDQEISRQMKLALGEGGE